MRVRVALSLMVVGVGLQLAACAARAQQAAKPELAFEAASVRQNDETGRTAISTNVPLDTEDAFAPTGGLFMAKGFTLLNYLTFAYRQLDTPTLRKQLPAWATTTKFDIDARAAGNPSKDEYREMMRALLAQRFKLQAHTETRTIPIYAMVLVKPGQPGTQLKAHNAAVPCAPAPSAGRGGVIFEAPPAGANLMKPTALVGTFPSFCGSFVGGVPVDSENMPGFFMAGGRNMSMELIADFFSQRGPRNNLGEKPIFDRTGLTGKFDFIVEWSSFNNTFTEKAGPGMVEALKNQMGIKLEATQSPVEMLVVDHIEQPTEN
jgi:uncharacterized protein (TIGR03435 family)